MKKIQKTGRKIRFKILIAIFFVSALLNLASWFFKPAVAWYRQYVFPLWTDTLARVMSVFPFSVGEILIYCGIFVIIFAALLFVTGFLFRGKRMKRFRRGYYEFLLWVIAWVVVTETLNCFVLYHAPTVEEEYFDNRTYGKEELFLVYRELVGRANELAPEMQRDADGNVVYSGDMYAACKTAMQQLGTEYPYLSGYYPNPKKIAASDFMSQQYLCGIYFPFTLEANYNATMYIMNDAATICHEFSHLKGVILEDEANYFGFLACIQSDDAFLQYSGYLSVLNYVAGEVKKVASEEELSELPGASEWVINDIVFLTKDAWDRVEQKAVISTETANKTTDKFLQSNLKANGVSDGMASYSRVVRLLLDYYDGILWKSEE